jgi:cholesterol transport system auxiliary component
MTTTAGVERESDIGARRRRRNGVALIAIIGLTLLGGCSLLGGQRTPATIYAPDPRVAPDPAWPAVDWQLEIASPDAARMLDSQRIAVRPTPGQLEVYKGASWATSPSNRVQTAVLRALEDSNKIAAVARKGSGLAADYTLLMELRRYDADYAGHAVPAATIEVNAKLLRSPDQAIIASRTFLQAIPATATDTGSVAQAFGTALAAIAHDVAGWTLASGEQSPSRPANH